MQSDFWPGWSCSFEFRLIELCTFVRWWAYWWCIWSDRFIGPNDKSDSPASTMYSHFWMCGFLEMFGLFAMFMTRNVSNKYSRTIEQEPLNQSISYAHPFCTKRTRLRQHSPIFAEIFDSHLTDNMHFHIIRISALKFPDSETTIRSSDYVNCMHWILWTQRSSGSLFVPCIFIWNVNMFA